MSPPLRPWRGVAILALVAAGTLTAPPSSAAAGVTGTAGVPQKAAAAAVTGPDGLAAGNAALSSVDLAGTWSFTPAGRAATTITVPGGGWYKQGFTDVTEAVYSRSITVPDSGQPQAVRIEFGAVNHEATLSVDGTVVGTNTTAFTPSVFDITPYVTPGSTHTISVRVKGRGALRNSANTKYVVPTAAEWSEAIPQGIFRSAFLRVYPEVFVSDTFVRTSVAGDTLAYDVTLTNTSASTRSVTLTGSLASANGTSFAYPGLPSRSVDVPANASATVTVGPVTWGLGASSYWWPNVPYRAGYRAQLHTLAVHAAVSTGRTSDASYRFGFRESTQNGEYYYLNGVRVNYRGDNLQGANYDRIDNGGIGDAFDTLPGFLPPSGSNAGWPKAVDNYQRLNYNVVRIHQEPASPYMLDVADEMGLMLVDETAIRGSNNGEDFDEGRANMVNHARALVLRDRNHAAVLRWSQANEPSYSNDSEQFQQELYAAVNGADGTRPVIVDGERPDRYPNMTQANFAVFPHYIDGFGKYGEAVWAVTGRPDGETEYIWPAANTKRGFTWFATSTAAKRGKDASDLRPYTLLSGWASFVPGVRTTDFTLEEGGRPIYGENNLSDPWANPQIQRIQAAFNPVAAIDLPYWSASGASDANGAFPLPDAVDNYDHGTTVTRTVTVFNDTLSDTSVDFTWSAHADTPDGPVVDSGSSTLSIPLGSRVNQQVSFTTPASGSKVYLVLSTAKGGTTLFTDAAQYFTLGSGVTTIDDASSTIDYTGTWGHGTGEAGLYAGTNSYSDTTGATATVTFTGTRVTLRGVTAPNHGIAAVSVDGGAETTVDQYAATRTGDVALWTSPPLASGEHTLRIRVTGDANSAASHDWVTVDRIQVDTGAIPGVAYTVVNRRSGKLLDVYQESTADGGKVVQWSATGGTNQRWTVQTASGNYLKLVNGASGKLLDVDGGRTTEGLQLQQWADNGGTNQQWQIKPTGDGYFTIVNRASGKLVDVYQESTADGGQVVQWSVTGGTNQQWRLVPA